MEPINKDLAALAAMVKWPARNADGTTTIDDDLLRRVGAVLSGLVNYIEVQMRRCQVPKGADEN